MATDTAQKVDLGIPSLLCTDFAYSLRKFKAKLPYVVRRHIPPESVKYTFSGGYAKLATLEDSRVLSTEPQRLCRLVYPDLVAAARPR